MRPLRTLAVAIAIAGSAAVVSAAPITEIELNNSLATAQPIPVGAFTTPVPATVFNPPGYSTATISGLGGGQTNDVDFYSFSANGGQVYFDIDNNPFQFDTILSLFDSSGTLIAYDDDSFPEDAGTQNGFDSFLGVFTLPGAGTYYIAVSQFSNFPQVLSSQVTSVRLQRPDFVPNQPDASLRTGGFAVIGATPGNSAYSAGPVTASGTLSYTLHVSVQNPAGQVVPEPATLLLLGAGLSATAARFRRRR